MLETKTFRNQSGQTLVETLIGAVLISLAALAVSQVVVQSANVTVNARTVTEFSSLMAQIRGDIASEQSCRLMLGGPLTYGGAPRVTTLVYVALGPFTYPPALGGMPIALYNITGPNINTAYLWDPNYVLPTPPPATPDTWNEWQIKNIVLSADPGVTQNAVNIHPAILNVVAERTGSGADSYREEGTIRLTLETANIGGITYIVSCAPITYGTDIVANPTCNPANSALVSDGTRTYCRLIRCPGGQTQYTGPAPPSYDANGNVNCH